MDVQLLDENDKYQILETNKLSFHGYTCTTLDDTSDGKYRKIIVR